MTTIPTKPFLHAFAFAASAANERSTLPALSHVLVTSTGCTGDSLMVRKTAYIDLPVEAPMLLPARLFLTFLRSCEGEALSLEKNTNRIKAKCGAMEAEFAIMDVEKFPKESEDNGKPCRTFKADELKQCLSAVRPMVYEGVDRPSLAGVILETEKNTLHFVASNGYTLGVVKSGLCSTPVATLVPRAVVDEIIASLPGGESPVEVTVGNTITVDGDGYKVTGKLVAEKPPQWQVFQKRNEKAKPFTVAREPFLAAIKRAIPFTEYAAPCVRLDFTKSAVEIGAKGIHSHHDELDCKAPEPLSCAFNPTYLLAVLKPLQGEEITLHLESLSGLYVEEGNYKAVCLPIRL